MDGFARYQMNPHVVSAMQWTGNELAPPVLPGCFMAVGPDGYWYMHAPHFGKKKVLPGDWIALMPDGRVTIYERDYFAMRFTPAA